MRKHLAIFKGNGAEDILMGKKTIESRFSKARIAPFGVISVGDLVYIKPSGKEPIGQFRVQKVISLDGLTLEDLGSIKKTYGKGIAADESFWALKQDSKYGTLIFIGQTNRFLTSPVKFTKKDLRGWVVLE